LAAKLVKPVQVWLKMDSGMHRVGLSPDAYKQAYMRLVAHTNVEKVVLMSHFANADSLSSEHTLQQISVFQKTIIGLGFNEAGSNEIGAAEISLANSAAILGWSQARASWSRPGIMLYGADPLMVADTKLRAVMQLTSKIISIRHIKKGESIGYGSIFTAPRDTVVGVVACGYADGYPRSASKQSTIVAPAAVDGVMTRLIGRVSMDMLFVELTDIPQAHIGSHVELWGDQVAANDVAKAAGTIAYELFCNVKRVQFMYSDNQ
jgi:alanine racemase